MLLSPEQWKSKVVGGRVWSAILITSSLVTIAFGGVAKVFMWVSWGLTPTEYLALGLGLGVVFLAVLSVRLYFETVSHSVQGDASERFRKDAETIALKMVALSMADEIANSALQALQSRAIELFRTAQNEGILPTSIPLRTHPLGNLHAWMALYGYGERTWAGMVESLRFIGPEVSAASPDDATKRWAVLLHDPRQLPHLRDCSVSLVRAVARASPEPRLKPRKAD